MSNIDIPDYVQVVVNPYNNKFAANRKGILVSGPWTDEIIGFVKKNNIKAIYLNSARGWKDLDYSFLSHLQGIEELNIISSFAKNLASIEAITSLMELSITTSTKDEINFSKLPKLERCYLYWWEGASSIIECSSLKYLYLDKLILKEIPKLSSLKNLRSLTIANSTIKSLEWLNQLSNLSELELLNCTKLSDFSPVHSCKKLKKLAICGSKILSSLDWISKLRDLEILIISDNGEIDSLKPLSTLGEIKALSFAGNTIIKDGDLSVLESLPKLSMLMFQARKHYNRKLIKKWDWDNFNYPDTLLTN